MTLTIKTNEKSNSNTSLWVGETSASLLVNLTNLFTVERIFDRDAILTYFTYFPGCPASLSTGLRGAESANIGDPRLGGACAGVSCIKGFDSKGAGTEGVCTVGGCSGGACIRNNCIGSVCDMGNCIRSAGISSIYGSAHKPSKSSV